LSPSAQPYPYDTLTEFARALFASTGFDADKSEAIARVLLEADLMGHTTHGLALVPWYVAAAGSGEMTRDGEPQVVSDRGACVVWNGRRLPGTWLTSRAVDLAIERARAFGIASVSIGESHHSGALAAYLERVTSVGLAALITCSTASVSAVAPFGGMKSLLTPNPFAAGFPTDGDPIILDISASITTLSMVKEKAAAGENFAHDWLLTADGRPTNDPQAVMSEGGSLLPVGGLDHGHKGYALGLLIESMTHGFSGVGRADAPSGNCTSIYVQVMDPEGFAGLANFTRQTEWLAEACRANPPRPGVEAVRVPGDRAMRLKRQALAEGVRLSEATVAALKTQAEALGVTAPF
jgi:LDH2 family malate/lactate/ureidoglycolate dehydrogenase